MQLAKAIDHLGKTARDNVPILQQKGRCGRKAGIDPLTGEGV